MVKDIQKIVNRRKNALEKKNDFMMQSTEVSSYNTGINSDRLNEEADDMSEEDPEPNFFDFKNATKSLLMQ